MLSVAEVAKVADLSKLHLSDEELAHFTEQLGRFMEYVTCLEEADVADVEPLSNIANLENVFREDSLRDSLSRDQTMRNAPKTDGKFFLVPPMFGID